MQIARSDIKKLFVLRPPASLLFLSLWALTSIPVEAQEESSQSSELDEVVVTAEMGRRNAFGQSEVELSDSELVLKMSPTLGETLADEIGVHNASYGPGVGLPVLRGLSGVRVRLSEDGIGAWDASSASADHATSIEPATAKSIRVVKGPATVLHGNNAIGGTVEVTNGRIAQDQEDLYNDSVLELRQEIANDHERNSTVAKFKRVVGNFVFQVDGFSRRSDDMSIPGIAIDEQAIGEVFGITNSDNTFGTVLNTDSEANSGTLAFSAVLSDHYLGVSSTLLDNNYGIPPGAHTEPADSPGHNHSHPVGGAIAAQTRVRIDLEQKRHLLKFGGMLADQGLKSYDFSAGIVDYEHREFETSASTGDRFDGVLYENDVVELGLEFEHDGFGFFGDNHQGTLGVQWIDREFSARSETAGSVDSFIPAADQQSFGLFFYNLFPKDWGSVELGGRYERQKMVQREPTAPLSPSDLQFIYSPLTYNTYTFSTALEYNIAANQNVGVSLTAAQRAPDIQELLSLGPHLATRSYDIGLLINGGGGAPPRPERFYGIEASWQSETIFGQMDSALFYTRAYDFIYQARRQEQGFYDISDQTFRGNCVRLEECIAIFDYTQAEVSLYGFEWEWKMPAIVSTLGELQPILFADFVRAKIIDQGDVPRMPPRRQGVGIDWRHQSLTGELRYSYVSKQGKQGDSETETSSYELLNASFFVRFEPDGEREPAVMLFLRGKNLLNQTIRKSTSFLRNFTPEPGREISVGVRLDF